MNKSRFFILLTALFFMSACSSSQQMAFRRAGLFAHQEQKVVSDTLFAEGDVVVDPVSPESPETARNPLQTLSSKEENWPAGTSLPEDIRPLEPENFNSPSGGQPDSLKQQNPGDDEPDDELEDDYVPKYEPLSRIAFWMAIAGVASSPFISVFSLLLIIPALVMSIISLDRIAYGKHNYKGKGYAIAALVISLLFILMAILIIVFFLLLFI